MFATPDIEDLTPGIFSSKISKGKSIIFSNNISLIWQKTKSPQLAETIKNVLLKSINEKNIFYSDSNEQFNIYIWKIRKKYIIWLTNYSGIEQNGFFNKISKIEINIPNNLSYFKNIFNYNNSSVFFKNKNKTLVIKNLNLWECIIIK